MFILVIFVNPCSETHLYTQLKGTSFRTFILPTQSTVYTEIEKFFDGSTVPQTGFTNTVKQKSGCHMLSEGLPRLKIF